MVVLNSRIKFRVSWQSTTWKDTEAGRLPPMGNVMHGDNSSSIIGNPREVKVKARSGDIQFAAVSSEVRLIYAITIGRN